MNHRKYSADVDNLQSKIGEGGANILETNVLSVPVHYTGVCKRDTIDLTELARKRWVEKLSMDRIATDMGWGRTAVIQHLGRIRANPDLVTDSQVRLRVYRRKNKFIGQG